MNRFKFSIALVLANAGIFVVVFALQPNREGSRIILRTASGEPYHSGSSVWETPSLVLVGTLLVSASIVVLSSRGREKR